MIPIGLERDIPRTYQFMPPYAQEVYWERLMIMREGNNIPDDAPTPWQIIKHATDAAMDEERDL